MSDLSDLVCLAHDHGDREQEAICSARFQIAALRSHLTTAERERDEARRERDAVREQYAMSLEEHGELMRQREDTSSQLWDCMNERDGWKHRAERAERQLSEVRLLCDEWPNYIALNVLNILDAAEGTP